MKTLVDVRENATRNESGNQRKLKGGRPLVKKPEGFFLFGCYHMLQHANSPLPTLEGRKAKPTRRLIIDKSVG